MDMRPFRLLVAIAAAACMRSESVADVAGHVPPLEALSNVRLGMRAYALRRARPRAVAAPYLGFRERAGSYEIWYEVPGSVQDGEAPPLWAPLQSVTVWERLDDAKNVFTLWQMAVRRAAVSLGAGPVCYALSSPARTAWLAVWPRRNDEVFVAGQMTREDSTPGVVSGTLTTGVARAGHALSRAVFSANMVRPCGELVTAGRP